MAEPAPDRPEDPTTRTLVRGIAVHPLFLSLVSFFVLSLIAFRRNTAYLFHGLDGRFEVSLVAQGTLFSPPMLGYTNDFLHGLGNISFTMNPWFIAGYFMALSAPGEFTAFALAYAICATELFVATYVAGRVAGASRLGAVAAGWVISLVSFQYAGWNLIPTTFRAFPHYASVAAVATLLSGSLIVIGRSRAVIAMSLACLCFVGISYLVVIAPTLLILVAPELAMFGLVALLAAEGRRRFVTTLGAFATVVVACVAAGYVHFIAGLVSYTAADVFKGLSMRPGDLGEVSMLFWSPLRPRFFTIERSFVLLGLLGGVWAIGRGSRARRLSAIAFVGVACLYLLVGIVNAHRRFWFGPAFWYFEGFLFPYHAVFATLLAADATHGAGRLGARLWRRVRGSPPPVLTVAAPLAGVLVALGPWVYVRHAQRLAGPPDLPFYAPHRQAETAITRILKDEIGLWPGSPFRGREATLTGRIFPPSRNVDQIGLAGVADFLAMRASGNSHNAAGLWQDSIPTLLEYNPLMTPAYFAFARTFFTEPADRQIRNIVSMRRIDPRLLAAVGVRFVVTDAPFMGLVRLRQTLPVNVSDDLLRRSGISEPIQNFSLYLYELDNVNVGQYSPIDVRVAASASTMLDLLSDAQLDLSRTLIVPPDVVVPEPLVGGTLLAFRVEEGQFTVRATSRGRSVLVLPMEYSRCLRVRSQDGQGGSMRLFRVDLLLTGILFDRELDATVAYRTGPLTDSRCRLRDARDMRRIEMKDAFKRRPELAPTRMVIQ